MNEVFGPITPVLLIGLVAAGTEAIKRNWNLDGRRVQLVAFLLSLIIIGGFHTITGGRALPPDASAWDVAYLFYSGLIYSLLGAASAIGMYEVARKHGAQEQEMPY
jgi:hypothetical protein